MAAYVPRHHFIYDEWVRPLPFLKLCWSSFEIFDAEIDSTNNLLNFLSFLAFWWGRNG